MTRRLVLRTETLGELTTAELQQVAAAEATTVCVFTIGRSCGIVCHTAGGGCFTESR